MEKRQFAALRHKSQDWVPTCRAMESNSFLDYTDDIVLALIISYLISPSSFTDWQRIDYVASMNWNQPAQAQFAAAAGAQSVGGLDADPDWLLDYRLRNK